MKIYLATWLLEKSQGVSLSKINKKERLLSYYHIKQKEVDVFIQYLKSGK